MGIELRLLGTEGEQAQALPDVESLTLSPVLCDAGTIEFQYPVAGINASHIIGRDEFELAVFLDGIRRPELDAIVKDVDGDDIEEDGVWKFTGFFNNGRMDEAITYPANWPNVDPENPNLIFTSATAGTIVGTLMQQAKSRGTLLDIDYSSFSTTHDSNGVEWTLTISLEFVPQVSYLDVLKNLFEQGLCEWQMVGKSLRLYVRDSMAEDRTLQDPPLVFRKGRDLADSPRKRSTRELATAYLTAGSQGLYHEAVNGAAVAARRRIEGGSSQGNVSDRGTLIAYTDAQLQRVSTPKMEKTHGLEFADEDTPRPMRHFDVGDWAYTDTGAGLERLRIKQWVIKNNADGSLTGSVTMNDFFAEQDEKTAKRVSGIIGGSTIAGGSRAEARMPADAANGIRPAQVVGLDVQSSAYIDASGQTLAQITASWQQVTTNEDGTVLDDFGRYLIEYQQPELHGEDNWVRVDAGTATIRSWSPVAAGEETRVRARAEDKWGNVGEWSDLQIIESGADAVPPPVPTAPTVDNYLGLLRVRWDGTFLNGQARPFDFARVDVHVSDVNFFEPGEDTRVGPLSTAGSVFDDVPYGEVRYARLVAYDATGNASDPSDLGEGTSSQVVSADIFDGAVGSAKLADLAVITAKIADLAVNNAKIGAMEVGKLTAGILNAEVTVAGRIATALAGKRMELNGIGLQGWDATGNQTINLDGINNLLTGRYRTALTGRRIELGSAGTAGEIVFFSPNNQKQYLRSSLWPQDNGAVVEALALRSGPEALLQLTDDNTISMWGWTAAVQMRDSFTVRAGDSSLVQNQVSRLTINGKNGDITWGFGVGAGWWNYKASSGGNSPLLQMFVPSGFGNLIKVFNDSRGAWTEFKGWDDGGFVGIRASNFEVNSDMRSKRDITDANLSARAMVRQAKVKRYVRDRVDFAAERDEKGDPTGRRKPGSERDNTREEIGLIAQEAPSQIVIGDAETGMGIDLYQMVSVLWAAVQELDGEIEKEGKKNDPTV